jgi:hypothetical protein
MVSPTAPDTRTRTQPEMFCPKSTSVFPVGDVVIETRRSVSIARTGGPTGDSNRVATKGRVATGSQALSS